MRYPFRFSQVVWSAVAASCAFPNLFPPQPLLAKSRGGALVGWQPEGKSGPRRWRDGSLEEDLPMRGLSELFNVNYFIVSQTNPHIVPILRLKRALCKRSATWAIAAAFLESEWKHRCRQVRELAPWLDVFGVFSLFGQQWEGDVTVVMPFTAAQLSRVVSNPDVDYLFATALQGEREMWPRLATIDANCGIEMQLDECARELRARLHRSVSLARRGRVVRVLRSRACLLIMLRGTDACLRRSHPGTRLEGSRTSHWVATALAACAPRLRTWAATPAPRRSRRASWATAAALRCTSRVAAAAALCPRCRLQSRPRRGGPSRVAERTQMHEAEAPVRRFLN